MKVAALDLGSNTFLCLIAEVEKNQVQKIYQDEVEIVRLGQGLSQNKKFHPEALQRTEKTLKKFSEIIKKHNPDKVLAMATSAARDAENKEVLFELGQKFNIPIEIIPGDKEAAITYSGSVSGFSDSNKNFMVLDIGGGSTEFIFGKGQELLSGKSFDIGCVRLTEKFISSQPTPDKDVEKAIEFVDEAIKNALKIKPTDFLVHEIVAVAGTPTALAAAEIGKFEPGLIDGYKITEKQLQDWLQRFQPSSVEDKIKMGIPTGRADVILIGVIILMRTLKVFGLSQLTVSTRGVRYGVALEMALRFCR